MGNYFRKTKWKQSKDELQSSKNQLYKLYQSICKKCHKNAADRLIRDMRTKYPNKSLLWIYEKILYDLERDF